MDNSDREVAIMAAHTHGRSRHVRLQGAGVLGGASDLTAAKTQGAIFWLEIWPCTTALGAIGGPIRGRSLVVTYCSISST